MKLTHRFQYLALLSALGLQACSDPKSADTEGSTTALTTTDNGTTAAGSTTGTNPTGTNPTDSGATDSGTTASGTTGPGPTTGEVSDPALYEQCKTTNDVTAMLAEAQCNCLVASGSFPDLDSCLAEFGTTPEEADCVCMIYAKNPETKEILDCISGPQLTYADCITKAGCDDQEALQMCSEAYFNVSLGCPEPTMAVNNQIGFECLGETPFMCGSGEQFPDYYQCDFNKDCMDGSDEVGCPGTFMCMNGATIPEEYKCDTFLDCCEGDPDCRDMSDEAGCPVFMCKNGDVIPEAYKCDGEQDCEDGSDEESCS